MIQSEENMMLKENIDKIMQIDEVGEWLGRLWFPRTIKSPHRVSSPPRQFEPSGLFPTELHGAKACSTDYGRYFKG